jgi:hypothetical protein
MKMVESLEGRVMDIETVVPVGILLSLELPVAWIPRFVWGKDSDDPFGRPLHPKIHVVPDLSQIILEVFHVGPEAGKHETSVGRNSGHFDQSTDLFAKVLAVPSRLGYADEPSTAVVDPTVIRAAKKIRTATLNATHNAPTVTAHIEENPNLAVLASAHNDRLSPDIRCDVITPISHFALVGHVDPGVFEDAAHLVLENLRIRVNLRANLKIGFTLPHHVSVRRIAHAFPPGFNGLLATRYRITGG